MKRISAGDFGEYPGAFLKEDLDERIRTSCTLLSEDYRNSGNIKGSNEALKNIELAGEDAVPSFDPFDNLLVLQKKWEQLMEYTDAEEIREKMRDIVEK